MAEKRIKEEDVKVASEQLGVFKSFIELVKKYGPIKLFFNAVFYILVSCMLYIAFNPNMVFERYEAFQTERHALSNKYRIESKPLIRQYLNTLNEETDAYATFILEFHNGKSNPSGLQWQYADMNFMSDALDNDAKEDFQNLLLDKYNIFYELYETSNWEGSIEGLMLVDKRMAYKFDVDSIRYIGMEIIYGSNLCELGVLVTVYKDVERIDEIKLSKLLQKYAAAISPLLDWEFATSKKKKAER